MILIRVLITIILGIACMYFTIALFAWLTESFPIPASYLVDLPENSRINTLLLAALGHFSLAYFMICAATALSLVIFISQRDIFSYAIVFSMAACAYLLIFTLNSANYSYVPGWFFLLEGLVTLFVPILTASSLGLLKGYFATPSY